MTHDLGFLAALQVMPSELQKICEAAGKPDAPPLIELERQAWGFDHQQLGGALTAHWNLPIYCQAIAAHHHEPESAPEDLRQLAVLIYIADTLVYSGVTVSSLDFGYPMNGFGADPPTVLDNISIVRAGGHFWGAQVFPAIWMFSASKVFQGIRISNVDIVDPTYSGIMFQTQYIGGRPVNPITDTVFTNVTITGAHRSGDAYDAKSGYGIWANPLPEVGQGPAVGSATFHNLTLSDNFKDIENPTSTFTIIRN
jgi:hypothetical protein